MTQSNQFISGILRTHVYQHLSAILLSGLLVIFSAGESRANQPVTPPNWTVDPGAFQFNMSIIARVQYLGVPTNASGNIVGVFVGNELRGVATPVDVSGDMFYFITVYSNVASGENLKFKVYYQPNDAVYTSTQSLPFTTNALVGDIPSPYWIMVDNTSDLPPQLTTIPNDTTLVGIPFETIDLAAYLISDDGDPVTYSAVAGASLSASISGSVLTVTPVSGTWTGTDTVRVIATEQTSNMKSAAVTPKFTVNAFYAAPVLNTIPSQSRNTGQQFTDYDLDNSLVFSGSCRAFDYYVTPFSGTTANPGWTAPPPSSGPMTVIARPLFDDIQLAGSGAELAAFRGSTLIGKASPSGTAPNITYTLTLANLGTGNIIFKFYDAARQYLYTLPTSLAFVSGGSAGTSGSPYLVQFCPLTPTINPAGVVSIAINDNDWLGTLPVNYMVWDCPYSNVNSRRDTATASYTRFYSPNPAFTSASAVNFQENTCLELYDAQSYDPNFSEGSGLTYSIAGGADQSKFSINATTGKLGWNSFTPDFESPGDADANNVYEVTLRVTNTNNLTADLNLLVTITNNSVENFAPTINGGAAQTCLTTSTLLTATGGGTYLWSTAQTTASIGVTIAGTYTVTVTNAVLCTGMASITVNQSPTVSLAGSSSLVCIGDQISLLSSPSGGTAPYTFSWTGPDAFISSQEDPAPFASSASKAGSYQVVVTDSKGCTASGSQPVVFRSEAKAALSLTASSPVCAGAPVTLTVTPTGGATPYSYSWVGPNGFSSAVQNPPAFSAVAASSGTYRVTVTTQGGCVSTTSGAVAVNGSPAVTVSGATPVCQGSNIVLGSSTSGGTAPYSYLWSGPTSFTSTSATPIPFAATSAATGTYTVTVTDANGCTASGTRAISVSATNIAPTVSTTGNSPVCAGSSIILTSSATGGTTPYTYNWSGPSGFSSAAQNPAPFSASASLAGTYTVTVTTASGCAATATCIIQVNTRPVVSASSGSPVCSGNTVLLTSTAQGGSGGYSFAWAGPSGYTSSSEDPAGFTASASTAGTYTVSVTDGNGCIGTATTVLAVSTAPAVAVTTGPTCLNNSLALNATASSGTLPYIAYAWSGPNSFTSTSEDPAPFQLTAPRAGVYTVTVTDFAGCTATGSVTVTGNSSPTISASNSGPVCLGGQISLTSTPQGGTGTYSFMWSGPPGSGYSAAFQNPSVFTAGASSGGVYTVSVTDSNGCTGTGVTTVTLNSKPVVSAANNGPLCFGSTALLTSIITGGSGTYSGFIWNGPLGFASTSANPAGFVVNSVSQAGFYNLTVTDANGCTSTASTSLSISSSSAPSVVASSNTPVCASGVLNLTATPSGGSGNYSGYSWAGPNGFTSSTQNPSVSSLTTSSGGTYTVTVTDVTGCTASSSTAVTVNGASLSVTKTDIACAGGNTGSATLIHTGGTPPYSYLWSNGGTTAAISGLVAGTYTVTITPQGGGTCTQTISTQINQASALQVTLTTSTSACGGANGSATVSVSGGTSPYTYLWPASAGNQTSATASGLASGTYTVTVTDNVLCTATLAVTIGSGTGTTINAVANKGPICPGATVASTALSSTPSNSSTVFTWTGAASAGLANGTSTGSGAVIPAFTAGLLEGAYVVTVTASLNSCASTTTFTITVEDNTAPVISNCPANLTINNTAGLCSGVVSWTPPTASDNCGSALLVQNGGPSIGALLSVGSTQTVSYTASDNGGNNSTCSFTVTVSDTELPALNCPALSSSYGTDAGNCSYTIQGTTFNATASDNCGLQPGASGLSYVATGAYSGTGTQLGGVVLPRGTTVISWTATDVNNNTRTCSRTVTITDDDAPVITTCPPARIMYTSSNGTGDCSGGVPDFLGALVANDNCSSFANLVKIQNPAAGTTFSGIHGDVQVVGITVIDDTGNSTYCSTTVTISDNEKPVFVNCPTVINLNNDVDQCGANVFFTPPGATDNCFGQIVITQTSGTVPGTYVPVNTPQSVTFRAQDIAGNTEICQATIVVNDVQSPVLVCPAGVQDFDASASCNYIGTLPLNASATDNCSIATLSNNLNSTNSVVGYVFPLGNTVVIWTATDIYSNTQTCSYTVQVTDHTAPVISVCPPDRVINTSSNGTGDCTGPISNLLAELSVTDNCTSAGNLIKVQTPVSGSSFGAAHNDIQVIQYSVTDEAGNTSSCSTQLTLNDDENPVLTNCPPNLTASTTDQYPCYATRAWTHPGASDNCGISLLNFRILNPNNAVYGPVDIDPLNASYSFEVGNSVVTYQVADQKGNTATCSFSVTVTTVKSLVGNKIWHDQNGSGVQDAGEPGISGVLVTLSGTRLCDAALVSQTVTSDASGNYLFTDVEPGTYALTFGIPAGYIPTAPGKGSDELLDSDFGSMGMTDQFNVLVADTILSLDAGFYIPGRIGDLVWDDLNGNGLQDAGEPGIAGAAVLLTGTSGDGTPVSMSTTTDASGYFVFGSTASGSTVLVPGSYQVSFVTPSGGYVRTNANDPDGTDANDSDADPGTGAAVFEVISSGEYNTDYDAGFYLPPSIGNYAWNDSNANGIQDVNEQPLGGVSVVLTGVDGQGVSVSSTSTTDANGYYTFNNLVPGEYHLNFAPPSGYALTGHDLGGDDTKDNDANESLGGRTVDETLVSGENNTTYDAGFYAAVSVGDLVWLDKNANGVQDAGEPGLAGVIAQLLNGSGNPVLVDADDNPIVDQVTDANGNYQFTNLIPGSYRVKFTNPDVRYTLSKANQGTDDGQDCDADATTLTTHATTLTTGQYDPTLDAAYYIKGRVGNLAWHDINGNGVQDSGEPGLANTAVTLTGTDGFGTAATSGTTTDANGFYTIGNIVPGIYKITFGITPGGYTPTTADRGGNDATDSDYGVSGLTPVFTVQSADTILTFDAGYWLATRIGSLVWDDTNGNGLQDAGEPGIPGVSVILNGAEGDGDIVNLSTTTSATGEYAFGDQSSGSANLAPGTYNLTFVLPAGGYVPTRSNDADGTDANDSDADESTGSTAFEVLISGENNTTYDAGFYLPPSIGNNAWNDSNANGIQDVNEQPLGGVSVVLTGVDGQGVAVSATSTTDANGFYTFNNLVPGEYHLNFAPPSGYALTGHDLGGDDTKDNDANESLGGRTVDETLVSGEYNTTYDAGFYAAVSVGDLVWLDRNANGVQDAGEPGLAGVIATLLNGSGNQVLVDADDNPITAQVTDSNGYYKFTNLIPGSYRVKFTNPDVRYTLSKANQGTDDGQDCDADATTLTTHASTLTTGQYDSTLDAAYYIKGRVGNLAWHDINGNGVQDSGEPGLGNTAVTLLGTDGFGSVISRTTVTDASGLYTFGDIIPGTYRIGFGIPVGGYIPTTADLGGDDSSDSDYGSMGLTPVFPVLSSDTILTFDAGYWLATRIGSLVWDDTNGNGLQDAGEPGIPGVSVILNGTEGDGDIVNLSTTTSATGEYAFGDQSSGSANLAPGTYNLTFVLPAGGYVPTRSNDTDGTDANDSDADEATGSTAFEVLSSGENNPTYDAGFYLPPSIGNYVWTDVNANGLQDSDEPFIAGAQVILSGTDGQGTAVNQSKTTDIYGAFLFDNLLPGSYRLTFPTPSGMDRATYPNEGTDDSLDSDADPASGNTTVFEVLTSGEHNKTYDAAFLSFASIGDRVWEDYSANGVQDAGEPGLAGVSVALSGTTGNGTSVSRTAVTAADGSYLFNNLIPGTYKLTFTNPTGYLTTQAASPAGNSDTNSDADPVTGMTPSTVLVTGERDFTWDAGYYATDYGDLPSSYGTTNGASNGPSHILNPNLLLGLCADAELNGGNDTPSGTPVYGNCPTGADDENGIVFVTPPVQGADACVRVTAVNTTGSTAVLQGWMDFNGDGDVQDAGEELQLTNNGIIPAGGVSDALYCFPVPAQVAFLNGSANVRFRLSPAGGLGPLGPAIGGEVEDYRVDVGRVGNLVWSDANFNGVQDAGEKGIADVPVELVWAGPDGDLNTNTDNRTYNTVTNLSGQYYFSGIVKGTYRLRVLTPAMMSPARTDRGADDVRDSDGTLVNSDQSQVTQVFTIADPLNMPLGENSIGDQGVVAGYADAQTDETHDFGFAWLDYGDLPQENTSGQSYNTTQSETGAVHATTPQLVLGTCTDAERDGQPDDDAGVYDELTTDSGDGDDGINNKGIDSQDCVGTPYAVVSASSYLCENRLIVRQINDRGSYVYYVVNGDFSPQINAAGGIAQVIGSTVIISGNATTGVYSGNQTALVSCISQNDGVAESLIVIGGTASFSLACFDKDVVCNDDENGIRFETPLIPDNDACIRVTARNTTSGSAVLQGWIDWNGNRQLEPSEALVLSGNGSIPSGGITNGLFCFPVPAGAVFNEGRVYARFRLSPAGGLSPDGPGIYSNDAMPAGEVEDYIVEVGLVGNLVWEDRNFDGLQGNPAIEPGMNGVDIQLTWAGPDNDLATTADNRTYLQKTASVNGKAGMYYFRGLTNGTYRLTSTTPTDFTPTRLNQGANDQLDADDFVNGDVFTWPDVSNLILNESGVSDMPGQMAIFPDRHDDQTHDMGYVALDFGDNPDSYSTLLPNGAHATIVPGLYLGSGVDSERDGAPDTESGVVAPGGDDSTISAYTVGTSASGDDENALRFLTPLVPGYEACVEINTTATAPYTPAYLSAWMDYNGNDAFDTDEKITFTTINGVAANTAAPAVPSGTATRRYCFNVLSTATFTDGEAYVRLRLNTTPDIAPTGLVIYGEVEDHWQPLLMSGNYAWMDSDIEGDQDATEMALAGVPVQLRWAGEDQVFGNADDRLYETTTASDGRYRFFGLIPGPYRITPVKYTSTVSNPIAGVEPLGKILTIANLPPANDNKDSDASPSISLTVPDMISTFTVTGEDGLNDNNGQNNAFPDNRENLSLDMGFIDDPVFASALSIRGVAKSSSGICGQFDVIMDLCIRNTGKVPVNTLQAVLDLGGPTAFGSMFLGLTPGGAPQLLNSTAQQNPALNGGYNGSGNTSLFNGTSGLLWPDEQVCVRLRFELNPTSAGAPASPKVQALVTSRAVNFQNVPVVNYFTGSQVSLTDLSDDGTDPASTNPWAPGDTGGRNDATPLTNCWEISQPLAQNDIVRISVDSTCVTTVYAGSVLEGEADKCLDDTYPLGGYYKVKLKNQNTGVEIPNPLTAAFIGQTIVVEVEHVVSCNKTWGKIRLEDNLAPKLACPADVIVACSESTDIQHTGDVLINDCTPTAVQIDNVVVDFDPCHTPRRVIERTFVVTDAWNNQSSCSQTITMIPFSLAEVDLPADITVNCESAYLNPGATAPTVTGQPSINGAPIGQGGYCSASIGYTDVRLEICKGSYEIYRTWIISNTCVPTGAGNAISHLQRILVEDAGGPQFACPGDITVSVDPTSCCATAALPEMVLTEGCSDIVNLEAKVTGIDFNTSNLVTFTVPGQLSDFPGNNYWNADTLAVFPYTNCLPNNSVYTVQYTAEDECGNTSACNFNLTVADLVPPVAACDQFTQVGITGGGEAYVDATTFDNGSYDNCTSVLSFKVRRMDANSCDENSAFDDQVKFCCADAGDTINVIFRAYDMVTGTGMVAIDTFEGHYNDCMVQVLVEDKTKPTCSAPVNVTVTCEQFDPSLGNYGFATSTDNCCVDTIKVTSNYTQFDTLCNKGTVVRTFRAFDCAGNATQCAQRIVVEYLQDYYVRFPDDKIITFCDGTGNYDEPTFYGEDCELLGVTYEDEIFTVVPDACFKIERNWRIINWCTFSPNGGCAEVPNPNPNVATNHASNLPGPIVSPIQTAGDPWKSTIVKVNPNDAQATNYSVFFSANANCYSYKQIIKIIDTQDPVADCTAIVDTVCDETANDASLWNEMYWWDPANSSHDLADAPSEISLTATDACSGANISFEYQLLLDLDGDGTMETVVNSTQLGSQPGGLGWNNIQYNNLNGAPVSRQFDNRPVAPNQKWGFAIQEVVTGNKKTAYVKFNTQQAQNTFVTPQLPYGNHKIKWFVTDGCGNETICEYPVEIRDCKAPTVVCFNGLSVNIMPSGMISLNDMDLLQFTEDNHTQKQFLHTGVRKCGTGSGFPLDANGNPVTSVTFDCSEMGTQCVEVWSEDLSGNAGYCEMYVIIQDNDGNCPNSDKVNVSGALKTEEDNGVEEALVKIEGTSSLTIPFSFQDITDSLGIYKVFHSVPVDASFTITADKDDSALNGVTTYDLVLISRHILGVSPLGSPYKMIAADANRSGSITTFDIVELRKLILGLYTELPNNTSWRFVDRNQVFTNPMNPFADTIREYITVQNALMNQTDKHFTGVKIGDVNGTAIANTAMQADERTSGTLLFDVEDRAVKAGETFDVTFKASEPVQGYQMTLNLKGLKVTGIVKSEKVSEGNFGVFEDALTISIDGSEEFTVTFTAGSTGKLSEMLGVSSRITRAEAYSTANNLLDVALRFGGSTIRGVGFELYQNQPNPFVNRTLIGFHLPEAQSAILTIADESGRIIYTQKGDYSKGYNAVQLDRALLNTTGVLYYTLSAEGGIATRKMIQSK